MLRSLCARLAMAVALLITALAAPASAQSAETPRFARWNEAADRFDSLLAAAAQRGEVPRMSDPEAAEVLRVMYDADATLGDRRFDLNETRELMGILRRLVRIAEIYDGHGLAPERPRDRYHSLVAYQDVVVPHFIFMVDVTSSLLSAVGDHMDADQRFRASVASNMGSGGSNLGFLVDLGLEAVRLERLPPERRLAIASVFGRVGPSLARNMNLAERATVRARVIAARDASAPHLRPALDVFAVALQDRSCTGLCSL